MDDRFRETMEALIVESFSETVLSYMTQHYDRETEVPTITLDEVRARRYTDVQSIDAQLLRNAVSTKPSYSIPVIEPSEITLKLRLDPPLRQRRFYIVNKDGSPLTPEAQAEIAEITARMNEEIGPIECKAEITSIEVRQYGHLRTDPTGTE